MICIEGGLCDGAKWFALIKCILFVHLFALPSNLFVMVCLQGNNYCMEHIY